MSNKVNKSEYFKNFQTSLEENNANKEQNL